MTDVLSKINEAFQEKSDLISGYGDGLVVRSFRGVQAYIIKGPGKFEGEPLYIEWYYVKSLDGCSDYEIDMSRPEDDTEDEGFYEESYGPIAFIFEVTPEDIVVWPELKDCVYVGFYSRDDGMVMTLSDDECGTLISQEDGNE